MRRRERLESHFGIHQQEQLEQRVGGSAGGREYTLVKLVPGSCVGFSLLRFDKNAGCGSFSSPGESFPEGRETKIPVGKLPCLHFPA